MSTKPATTEPLIIDIETGGLPRDQLEAICPEFNSETVAVGNLTDPDKITKKIAEAKAKWLDKAAMSPATGRVLAIGYHAPERMKSSLDHGKPEAELLANFWRKYSEIRTATRKLIGFAICAFDLPFLVRRSWILQVDVPGWVRNGRYFDSVFVDLQDAWLCGRQFGTEECSLDFVARALGVGRKPDGITGADFDRLYHGTPAEQKQALDYLQNDLSLTGAIAKRLGYV